MNVLLAEAQVPYEQLKEMDDINGEFKHADVVLVVGANDVVNPAAKTTPGAPIYGMPILNADEAKQVVFMKRSMRPGFAGIENELLFEPKHHAALRRRQGLDGQAAERGQGACDDDRVQPVNPGVTPLDSSPWKDAAIARDREGQHMPTTRTTATAARTDTATTRPSPTRTGQQGLGLRRPRPRW